MNNLEISLLFKKKLFLLSAPYVHTAVPPGWPLSKWSVFDEAAVEGGLQVCVFVSLRPSEVKEQR